MITQTGQRCAAVATPHPAAAEAARELLLRGGNAIDAAVGAMLACCVVTPGSVGVGGYGGSLVAYLVGEGRAIAIDFDSRAPLAYRPEAFRGERTRYERGALSITVPAVVAGLALALDRFGTLSWAVASARAIALAEEGVRISASLKRELDLWGKATDATSLRAVFPGGEVPEEGGVWMQHDLAGLLRRLAEEGPGAFYRGEVPGTIVRRVREQGGILAEEDFSRYRPEVVEPLAIDYKGYRVLTPPPPSGGWTSLQILRTLEQLALSEVPPLGAEYFHRLAEAVKRAWHDRVRFAGDPDVTPVPLGRLLSEETARVSAARIRRGGVARSASPPSPPSSAHTVNVLTADPAGNVVSLTATHGALYGSGVAIDGLGLVLGHGMSRFDLADGSPNAPAAGKRMAHNMAPAVILGKDGRVFAAVGTPGGTKIVTVSAQLVVDLIDFAMTPAAAVHAARIHVEADEPIEASPAVPDSVLEELRAIGHTVGRGRDASGLPGAIGGPANALRIDPTTRAVAAASQAGAYAALTFEV